VSAGTILGVAALLHEIRGVPEAISAALGLATALFVNFAVMRYFVFTGTRQPLLRQFMMFLGSSGIFRGGEYAGFFVMHLAGMNYLLALILVQGGSFIIKFFVYQNVVFARASGTQ
jgi:putative flippase GtrA